MKVYEFSTCSIVWQRQRNGSKQQRRLGNSYFILASIADLYGLYQYTSGAKNIIGKRVVE